MFRIRIWSVAAAVAAALVLLTAGASGQGVPSSQLGADVTEPGIVDLGYFGKPGSTVYFDERVGDAGKRLGSLSIGPNGYVVLSDAVAWRCERLERRFEATEVQPDGTRAGGSYDVRTGSCAQRFKLSAPPHAQRGTRARVRIVDRWNLGGVRTQLCITPPRGRAACRSLSFPRGVGVGSRRFRATKNGRWKIALRVGGHRVRAAVVVGPGGVAVKPAPIVLATGDSTIQGVDSFLADRLAETARVRSDVHHGTGISRGTEWVTRATKQALRLKPKTTVISIGAGEGQPMETPSGSRVECCGEPWLLEYRRRVALMMKSYVQQGRGKLLWLAVPTPRSALRAAITAQVNKAVLTAAEGRPGVKVLRLDGVFTPNGYREVIRYRGQDVRVRAADGVHLTAAGTAIAAEIIELTMRKGW